MSIEPTDIVRQYAPWSISKADTIRNCPRKFKYQYIEKIKGLKAPKEGDALVGKAVHKLLEYAVSLNRPANQFVNGVIIEFGLEGENADRFLALIPAADNLVARMAGYPQKYGTLLPKTEQKIAVSLDGKAVDFFDNAKGFFRGVLDVSYRVRDKNHLIIMDHKTGKYRGLDYYQSQFDGYRYLVKGLYPELEGVQVAVNYLQTNQTEFAPFKFVHDAGELCERVVVFLNKATARVDSLEAVKPGPLCPWCDFHSICPVHTADGAHGEENTDKDGKGTNA
jgi:hypothetical protein